LRFEDRLNIYGLIFGCPPVDKARVWLKDTREFSKRLLPSRDQVEDMDSDRAIKCMAGERRMRSICFEHRNRLVAAFVQQAAHHGCGDVEADIVTDEPRNGKRDASCADANFNDTLGTSKVSCTRDGSSNSGFYAGRKTARFVVIIYSTVKGY
jgi:hypothetical protein